MWKTLGSNNHSECSYTIREVLLIWVPAIHRFIYQSVGVCVCPTVWTQGRVQRLTHKQSDCTSHLVKTILKKALLNLKSHTSYFSHAVNYLHEYVTFWYVWNIRTTNFERFSQISNFRRVKNSHVFVTPVKNLFEFFTSVTNTCEFFTRVTDSFECESQTNLSQVWKIQTYMYLSHLWRIRANCTQMWQIHANPSLLYAWHVW